MDNKEIEKLWRMSKLELFSDNWIFEKATFDCLIDGMMLKIHEKYNKNHLQTDKTPKTDDTLLKLESMKSFLERLSFKNCISHFQVKIISSQENRILKLEIEKSEIIKELEELKKRIK